MPAWIWVLVVIGALAIFFALLIILSSIAENSKPPMVNIDYPPADHKGLCYACQRYITGEYKEDSGLRRYHLDCYAIWDAKGLIPTFRHNLLCAYCGNRVGEKENEEFEGFIYVNGLAYHEKCVEKEFSGGTNI